MGFPVHVSVQGNLVFADFPIPSPMATLHKVQPPVGPTIPIAPCIEAPVPVMWPPGFGLQQNKLTTTVYHKFQWIMLDGHDCGYMIPHVTIPPANLLLPLQIAFSSRKTIFAASTVKANGTPVACSELLLLPIPMMACAEPISFPTATPYLNVLNSVTVGMNWMDALAGLISMICTMACDAILAFVVKTPSDALGGGLTGKLLGKLLGASTLPQFLIKQGFAAVAGAAKILLTGEGQIQIKLGSAYGQVAVSYTRKDHANVFGVAGQIAPNPILGPSTVSVKYEHTSKPDGSTQNKTTEIAATPVGQVSHVSSTDKDASGKVTKETENTTEAGGISTPLGTAEGTHTTETTTKPGQAPVTKETASGGAAGPFGAGGHVWGGSL